MNTAGDKDYSCNTIEGATNFPVQSCYPSGPDSQLAGKRSITIQEHHPPNVASHHSLRCKSAREGNVSRRRVELTGKASSLLFKNTSWVFSHYTPAPCLRRLCPAEFFRPLVCRSLCRSVSTYSCHWHHTAHESYNAVPRARCLHLLHRPKLGCKYRRNGHPFLKQTVLYSSAIPDAIGSASMLSRK